MEELDDFEIMLMKEIEDMKNPKKRERIMRDELKTMLNEVFGEMKIEDLYSAQEYITSKINEVKMGAIKIGQNVIIKSGKMEAECIIHAIGDGIVYVKRADGSRIGASMTREYPFEKIDKIL